MYNNNKNDTNGHSDGHNGHTNGHNQGINMNRNTDQVSPSSSYSPTRRSSSPSSHNNNLPVKKIPVHIKVFQVSRPALHSLLLTLTLYK